MKVKFWGVRGSIPSPGVSTARYGGNASCVSMDLGGHKTLILDGGTGIRELGKALVSMGGSADSRGESFGRCSMFFPNRFSVFSLQGLWIAHIVRVMVYHLKAYRGESLQRARHKRVVRFWGVATRVGEVRMKR